MTVYHNMFLNREVTRGIGPLRFLSNRVMKKRSLEYLDDIGVRVPSIDAEVARMSGGQRQAIAIARSTHSDARILLLDEPLAAMGAREGALIITELIEELGRKSDVSMIVIAHNYVHVLEMCDRVNLLRNGRIELDKRTDETSVEELTEIVAAEYRARHQPAPDPRQRTLLEIDLVAVASRDLGPSRCPRRFGGGCPAARGTARSGRGTRARATGT